MELGRQRQAALIAAGEAGRAARLAAADGRDTPSRLARLAQSLLARLKRQDEKPRDLELERAIVIRTSGAVDRPALERLAALDSRKLPQGWFLLAEIDGELVAAAPIDVDVEPLSDPFRPMAAVRELLRLQADHIRRRRLTTPDRPVTRARRALSDPA